MRSETFRIIVETAALIWLIMLIIHMKGLMHHQMGISLLLDKEKPEDNSKFLVRTLKRIRLFWLKLILSRLDRVKWVVQDLTTTPMLSQASKETTTKLQLEQQPPNQVASSPLTQDLFQKKPLLKTKTQVISRFQWVISEGLHETKDKKLICENEVNTKFIKQG